ncbi:MAG TPA: HD domain-containing phosphohydrolase, partial [Pseudobdellovibrionaceae bacterium]|nr:HD domain-containing phosphohydrolase [Pseudobdellovibrionaceae bacterium]
LNVSLSRRLPIGEGMKDIILNTHEKNDGTGFPNRFRGEKIPHEAQLIQFCELIDRGSLIKMGKERKSAAQVRKEIFDREFTEGKYFNILFLDKIKSVI